MYKKVFRHIYLTAIILAFTPLFSFAENEGKFNNAITKIDFTPASNNGVTLNLYTKNPYTDKVKVNKKNDNYTIIVPQTDNWVGNKKYLENNPNIKKVTFKTYTGNNPNKNYTKITVETKKPLSVSTQPLIIKPQLRNSVTVEKATPITIASTTATNTNYTTPVAEVTPITPVSIVKAQTAATTPALRTPPQSKPLVKPQPKPYIQTNEIEILEIPSPKILKQNADNTDRFLFIPNDDEVEIDVKKEQESTKTKVDVSTISKSLMKDKPKQLSNKLKLNLNLFKLPRIISKAKLKELCSLEYNIKIFKILVKFLFIFACIYGLFYSISYIFKKKKSIEEFLDDEPTQEETASSELQKAMEEFAMVEEKVEKLEPKEYIKNVNDYKNLDGFKKYDIDTDILKTLDAIEKANKHGSPFVPNEENNQLMGYNYTNNKQLYKNPLEELTEEEEKALFDEPELTSEDETISAQYYNNIDEFFTKEIENEYNDNDIFIVEDEEEIQEQENKIVEIIEIPEQTTEPEPEIVEEQTPEESSNNTYQKNDVENIKTREKYEIDEKSGIALINYHQIFALIGYINSEIFLLKKFEGGISPENLSVRLSEKIDETTKHYIVRLDHEKWLVEVKPDNIKLLLSL